MSSSPAAHLWTVRYRRPGWTQEQVRDFRRRYAAQRLVMKLLDSSWEWEHLDPVEYVYLERRALGPVEIVKEYR